MNEFFGIDVEGEGRVVQSWFNGLTVYARDEILNMVLHLERLPMGLWEGVGDRSRDFDPLEGDGGISELRPMDIRSDEGNTVYRIYGWMGYPGSKSYKFLHGTDKDVKNDVEGKAIAKWRTEQLVRGEAHPHKFDFVGGTSLPTQGG
jgi:hypothetical protein